MCCNCMLVTDEPATMAGKPTKQQSLIFSFFDIPENVEGNFKAKCKLCTSQLSASTKASSNLVLYLRVLPI